MGWEGVVGRGLEVQVFVSIIDISVLCVRFFLCLYPVSEAATNRLQRLVVANLHMISTFLLPATVRRELNY